MNLLVYRLDYAIKSDQIILSAINRNLILCGQSMKNLFLSESRGLSDFVIEINQKYVDFTDEKIFELANDLELFQESFFLSGVFNKRPLRFDLEYIPSILKAKEQSLSTLISRLSPQSDDRKTQLTLETINKIFSFDRFCANNDAAIEFPPLNLLSHSRDSKLVTNWLLTAMAVLPLSKRINDFLTITISYLKPYSLMLAANDLTSLKKLLNELQEKAKINKQEQTIENIVKIVIENFKGDKTVEFWESWMTSAKEILLDKPDQKDLLEYATIMKATELSAESEGTIVGGLAFLFDLRDILFDANSGITNMLRKVAIAQAFLGKILCNCALIIFQKKAKVRVTLSRFCKRGRKFGVGKLLEFPFCLDPSYVDWVAEIAVNIENATESETEALKEFAVALYDFVKFASAYLRQPIKNPSEFFLVSSQVLQEKFQEFQQKLISPSKNNPLFASFSFVLQSITRYVLKFGRDASVSQKRENLSHAQRWLLRAFKILLRGTIQLRQPLDENFQEFIIEVVSFAQETILSLNVKQYYDTHFDTFYFIYIQVLVSQIEKCLETFKVEAIFSKMESTLFELYDSDFLLGLDFSLHFSNDMRSFRLLWISYYLSKLMNVCIGDKDQKMYVENPLISRNSDKMLSMILGSRLFELISLKKDLFKKYEFIYLSTRLYLTSVFQQIARKQEMRPIYLERLESSQSFESFLNFVCEFYQERWEKFSDIPYILCLSKSPKFEKKYLLQGGMIESCIVSFFEGNSSIPFRVNSERVVEALEKQFLTGEREELSPKRFQLLNSITTCHKIVFYIIQQKYQKVEALVKQVESDYQTHGDYKRLMMSLHRERYYVSILASLLKKFANTIDIPQQVIDTNRMIKIKWISQPWMVLYSDSKYTELCTDIELGVTKCSEITENLELNYDQYIKIQSNTSLMNFETIEILKEERLIELFKHFQKTENFKTDYFYESFSLDSLKFVHYLHFALNHSVCGQTPWFMLGYDWAKTKLPVLSQIIRTSIITHGISFENFLMASLRIFVRLSEKYFEALCRKEGPSVDYEKSYKQITSAYINGNTLVKFIKYIWNCLNLCFIVHPEHKAWDNIPVFEELEMIGMEDLSDKFQLAKKIFKNHVISKFFELALKNIASLVRNQRLISLRIIQRSESLGKFFNWIIALESQVEIFGQIEKKEKKVWLDILSEIMKESFLKRAMLNKDFGIEEPERFSLCTNAFDDFFGRLPELAKKSLLFLSDSASFGEMLMGLYKSLVAESKDSAFKNDIDKKNAFLWTLFKLRSPVAFSQKNKEYEQKLLSQGLPYEKFAQLDEFIPSKCSSDNIIETLGNFVAEASSSCGFLEKDQPLLYCSIQKLLIANFVYKSYLTRQESDLKKRLGMLLGVSSFLQENVLAIHIEHAFKREPTSSAHYSVIKKVFHKAVNLIFLLPICMSNSLIELYSECDPEQKLKVWKNVRELILLSYKFSKAYQKSEDDPSSVFEITSTTKMFGVLNFLFASYQENFSEGSFLDDKELKHLLTTPSTRFSLDNEFEGLFLAQVLSGSIDQEVLLEIRLNYQIFNNRLQESFKLIDVLSKVMDARITLLPNWLPDYFYSFLDLSGSIEEQHLSAKTKVSQFTDLSVLSYSTKDKTTVLEYLSSAAFSPNSIEIIDKILESIFSCLSRVAKESMIQENEQLSWCLSHIITIIDTHFYMIPYLLKKRVLLNEKSIDMRQSSENFQSDRPELYFLELILTVAFTYQPLLVESLIQVLIKNGEYIFAPSSAETEKPVNFSSLISLEILIIVGKALKHTLAEFNKNPAKMPIYTFNNYFKLLQALTRQISSGIKKLPGTVKNDFKVVIEDISGIIYLIFCELLFKNDKIKIQMINFKLLMMSLQTLFEAAYGFNTAAQMNWKKQHAFILTKLDVLHSLEEPQNCLKNNPSNLVFYFKHDRIPAEGIEKKSNFSLSTKRLNWSGFDGRSESNYYETFDDADESLGNLPDVSKQIKENINRKMRFITTAEYMEDFYSSLGGDSPPGDLANSVDNIESKLLPFVKEKQFPTSSEGKNQKAQPVEEKNGEEEIKIESIELSGVTKSLPSEPQDKVIVDSLNVPTEIEAEKKNVPSEISFSDKLNISLYEEIFEMGKDRDVLEVHCQEVCHLQKRFFERLLTFEARYYLNAIVLQLEVIMEARRDFLKEFLQSLPSQYLKLFWLFLSQQFKDLIKSKSEGDDELYLLCYDTIKQVLELDNLHQYTQIELFDALNFQFSNKPLNANANEKNPNPPKKCVNPKQVIEYNELQEFVFFTVKKKFFEDPEMIERASNSVKWLELKDSEMEKLLLFCACKNWNKIPIPDLFLLNLINELRFIGSLLELLEDKTLIKFQKLVSACNQEIKLEYNDLAAEIINFLADGLPVHVSSLVSLKVPEACLKNYVLPVLKSENDDLEILTSYQRNGFERIMSLLFDNQIEQKRHCVRGIIRLATNYLERINGFFVVKDPNYYELGQYHHQMLSIETAEKCWYFLVDILKSNNQSDREHYQRFFQWSRSLFKSYSFFNSLKHEFLYVYLNHFHKAKEQLLTLLPELKTKEKSLAAFQAEYESNIKPLTWLTDILCESIISQFRGITSRKDYREKNEESKGVLGRWSLILELFVSDLINSKDFIDLILSAFEIICLESKKLEQNSKSNNLTEQLFKLIVQIESSVILVKEIAVSEKVPSWKKIDLEEDKKGKGKEDGELEIKMEQREEEEKKGEEEKAEDLDAELLDLSLHRYVSTDLIEAPEVLPISLTFTEINDSRTLLKLDDILLHALMRTDRAFIVDLLAKMPDSDFSKTLFCAKFSFLQNLAQKERDAGIREAPSSHKTFEIDRKYHLQESVLAWAALSNNERARCKPKISYKHESGIDAGGLLRSWFVENTKILFSPSFGLFKMSHDSRMIHPSPTAKLVPGHLTLFEYAGYHIAMAIRTKSIIDVHFTKSFYKIILDRPLTLSDLEEVDSAWHSSLRWILDNDVDALFHTFSYEIDLCGERHAVELTTNGSKIYVTNENKELFVKFLAVAKMRKEVSAEINAFLFGFNTVLQTSLLNNFMPAELEAVIAGASKISVEDLKQNTNISQYNANFQQWLWEILEEFDQNQLSAFLYYVSGSTKVPFGGFKEQPIEINYRSDSTSLPVAHTCNRSLDLPEYSSKEILKEKLLKAMYEASGAFHIC